MNGKSKNEFNRKRIMEIESRNSIYLQNKKSKVGSMITCPVCGKKFFKKQYSQSFCSLHCKDSFWNFNQKSKRQGGGGHGNDSSACATVAVRNLSFDNDNGQRLGVNVFSW